MRRVFSGVAAVDAVEAWLSARATGGRHGRARPLALGGRLVPRVAAKGLRGHALDALAGDGGVGRERVTVCLLYTSPSPRDATLSRMPSSA